MRDVPASELGSVWTHRSCGGGRTERRYLDLLIDGLSLSSRIRAAATSPLVSDMISPFGRLDAELARSAIDRLVGLAPPDLPGERSSLCVCPECGDLSCGAIAVRVAFQPGVVAWRDFAAYGSDGTVRVAGFDGVGPFLFSDAPYRRFFEEVRARLEATL